MATKRSKVQHKSLLSLFMETPSGNHVPRNTTGDVDERKVGPVLVVDRDESLPRVFRQLVVEGFLSAPVVDGTRFVGFIDMMDLVKKTRDLFWADTVEAWTDFWDKEERFTTTTVDDIIQVPSPWDRDPSPPVDSDVTTFSALELMVRQNLHRVAVLKPGKMKIKGILTQSMLISWLRQNKSLLGNLRNKTVAEMLEIKDAAKSAMTDDIFVPTVQTISEDDKAINGFTRMAAQKISGLAVVDSEGLLTSVLSVRDLRGVGSGGEYFHRLFRSVKEFKKVAREEHSRLQPRTHYMSRVVPRKGLYVTADKTFEDVLNKMADGNIHRVFVCDDDLRPKPINVISQVDMLRCVLEECIREASTN